MSIETCYDVLTVGSLAVLVLLALVCLVRCILGPRISDRVMAVNMIGTLTIIMVVVFTVYLKEAYLADIALIYRWKRWFGMKRRVSGSERDSVCFDGGVHAGRPVRLLRRRVRRV